MRVFRGVGPDGKAKQTAVFARGLSRPFGIAFYPAKGEPSWVYVANTDSVVRFPYKSGDLEARGKPEMINDKIPGGGLLAAAGTGPATWPSPTTARRCSSRSARNPTTTTPTTTPRSFTGPPSWRSTPTAAGCASSPRASATRSGIAVNPAHRRALDLGQRARRAGRQPGPRLHHPGQGRRLLRLALVLHRRQPGPPTQGQAPRAEGQGDRPGRAAPAPQRLAAADVLRGQAVPRRLPAATSSPPSTAPGTARSAPATRSSAFPCTRRIEPPANTRTSSPASSPPEGEVWGRPVGVTIAPDGSLLVTDDGSKSIWRVSYTGK